MHVKSYVFLGHAMQIIHVRREKSQTCTFSLQSDSSFYVVRLFLKKHFKLLINDYVLDVVVAAVVPVAAVWAESDLILFVVLLLRRE